MPVADRRAHDHFATQLGDKPGKCHRPWHLTEGPQLVPGIEVLRRVDDVKVDRWLLVIAANGGDEKPLAGSADGDHEQPGLVIADSRLRRTQRQSAASDDIDQSL